MNTVEIRNLKKNYTLYKKPFDRVKEAFSITHKQYGQDRCVLDIDGLDIKAGEVVGIIGTNGSGKSTLLKIITGVLSQTRGEVKVKGKIAALLELGAGFNPEFTGLKNIYLNGTMMGFSHAQMEKKIQEIIDFADIGDFIEQPVKTYSSGMFARLAFAVAINVEPDILIVDEVLSVGDIRFQMKCMDKMKEMMDGGVTVLFVSHDINAIRRFCMKSLWLKEGKVQAYGETGKVCDQYMDYLKLLDAHMEQTAEKQGEASAAINESVADVRGKVQSGILAEVKNIVFRNEKGIEVSEIAWNDPMTIEVEYEVYDEHVKEPVLGVALKRIDDEYICGLNTLLDQVEIPWIKGRNYYRLIYTEGIRVLGGKYYFDVALFDKTATVPMQYCARIKELTVSADYIGEGICILPHEWSK
ncbi:MAG: ABC transporter ATP-binding protein [Lachnospiraceae bacterium]|nr:ABC transporter ATP-binding protein [Lachnospiraceae bacterium]